MAGLQGLVLGTKRPLQVAAYCRVSTENGQEESFETQRDFFVREITEHPEWELAGIFADNAKSGTMIKGRTDFLRMMRKAQAGKIDYIISKSISRFSRSVADTLKCLQELESLGVGVYFMEQNLDTGVRGNGIILSVLAGIAQMESESISQNLKMTLDAKNAMGNPVRKCAYGFKKVSGQWVIHEEEALRVKLGFLMASNGYSFTEIAKRLNEFEEYDRSGRRWDSSMVKRMLLNEAYIGDVLTNKNVVLTTESTKSLRPNENMVDQFYIDFHHEPLVGREVFAEIGRLNEQKELAGQANFKGTREAMELANHDPLLEGAKKYLPKTEGRWVRKLEAEQD